MFERLETRKESVSHSAHRIIKSEPLWLPSDFPLYRHGYWNRYMKLYHTVLKSTHLRVQFEVRTAFKCLESICKHFQPIDVLMGVSSLILVANTWNLSLLHPTPYLLLFPVSWPLAWPTSPMPKPMPTWKKLCKNATNLLSHSTGMHQNYFSTPTTQISSQWNTTQIGR